MTINEAYVKGLDDAENNIIDKFIKIMNGEDDGSPFNNPRLESLRQVVQERLDYFHEMAQRDNNVGVGFRNRIEDQKNRLTNI
jgi:hypothetical protein